MCFKKNKLPHQVGIKIGNKIVTKGNLIRVVRFSHVPNGLCAPWMKPISPECKKINVDAAMLKIKGYESDWLL